MDSKEKFDSIVEQLHENAFKDFKTTEQYRFIQEKISRMDSDCETLLNTNDQKFVTECFELLTEIGWQQEHYAYRKGLQDCVFLLKELGVLA